MHRTLPVYVRASFIFICRRLRTTPARDLVHALEIVLGEVRLAVQDWRPMRDRVTSIVAELKATPPPLPVDEIAEAIQFLQWLLADNFTFLGVRDYKVDGQMLNPDFETALGIMRSRELRVLKRGSELLEITPEIMAFLKEPRLLIIAKANIHSRVHRRAYLDYIGVKRFDFSGNLIGEHRIVGLFTSTAYTRGAHGIPYLRRKIAAVERHAGRVLRRGNELLESTPEIMAFMKEPRLLIIAKANVHARVHRRVYLDYVGVKRFELFGQSRRRTPHHRAVHLDGLYARRARHPLSATENRCGGTACRLRSGQSFRQGTG